MATKLMMRFKSSFKISDRNGWRMHSVNVCPMTVAGSRQGHFPAHSFFWHQTYDFHDAELGSWFEPLMFTSPFRLD